MPSLQEKSAFSARLKLAIRLNKKPVKGATDLARLFNLQHRDTKKNMGISVQTAHKWLTGGAIPSSDKIETLAKWLKVTSHWLHYGPPPQTENTQRKVNEYTPSEETLRLASKMDALSEHQQYLVAELIKQLYGKEY